MKIKNLGFAAIILAGLNAATSQAVTITGYDVLNASVSGTGAWSHSYTGTITPIGGGFADYSGGTGTMADGVIGASVGVTQLFCENNGGCSGNSATRPTITLFFDNSYLITDLSIFGGNHTSNSIPGAITGFDATIGATTVTIATSQFGAPGNSGQLVNDLANFVGTGLELLPTSQLILSNITYLEKGVTTWGRFSITEIQANGKISGVAIPATPALLALGLLGLLGSRRKA